MTSILSRYKRLSQPSPAASTGQPQPPAPSTTPPNRPADWAATPDELARLRAAAGPMTRRVVGFVGRYAAKLPPIKLDAALQKSLAALVAIKSPEAARLIRTFPASREGAMAYAEWRILQLGEDRVRAICEQVADMLDMWLTESETETEGEDDAGDVGAGLDAELPADGGAPVALDGV